MVLRALIFIFLNIILDSNEALKSHQQNAVWNKFLGSLDILELLLFKKSWKQKESYISDLKFCQEE